MLEKKISARPDGGLTIHLSDGENNWEIIVARKKDSDKCAVAEGPPVKPEKRVRTVVQAAKLFPNWESAIKEAQRLMECREKSGIP